MKARALTMSAALVLAVSAGSALAQESTPIAPPKTMGDEGNEVPEIGAIGPAEVGPQKAPHE
jgi:hypothetical protein